MKIVIPYVEKNEMMLRLLKSLEQCNPDAHLALYPDPDRKGFLLTVNKIFRETTEDIILLHTDMVVLPHWLDLLNHYAQRFPEAGIIGMKLVYPNGILQHVGGVIRENLVCGNAGSGEIDLGQYEQPSIRPFVTFGGCLIRRETIKKVGFMDEHFELAYYDDVDYCLRTWEAGFKVMYAPVKILHLETQTMNSDKYRIAQNNNYHYFVSKWKNKLVEMSKNGGFL